MIHNSSFDVYSLCVVWFHALAHIHKNIRTILVELAWPCQIAHCFSMMWDFKNLRISEICSLAAY